MLRTLAGLLLVAAAACQSKGAHPSRPRKTPPAPVDAGDARTPEDLDEEEAVATLCAVPRAQEAYFAEHSRFAEASAGPEESDHKPATRYQEGWFELGLPLSQHPRCEYEVRAVRADGPNQSLTPPARNAGFTPPRGPPWYAHAICRNRARELMLFVHEGAQSIKNVSPKVKRMAFGVASPRPDPDAALDHDHGCPR